MVLYGYITRVASPPPTPLRAHGCALARSGRLFREATGIGEDQQDKTKGTRRAAVLEKSKHEDESTKLSKVRVEGIDRVLYQVLKRSTALPNPPFVAILRLSWPRC